MQKLVVTISVCRQTSGRWILCHKADSHPDQACGIPCKSRVQWGRLVAWRKRHCRNRCLESPILETLGRA